MRLLIALIFFFSEVSYGALPPTTLSGQAQGSKPTTFNFLLPENQATKYNGVQSLIETGNENLASNPSFEHETVCTGWTVTSASCNQETTEVRAGKRSARIALTTTNTTFLNQNITPSIKLEGMNLEASIAVKTTLSDIQVCSRLAGVEVQCLSVLNDGKWHDYSPTMIGPSSGSVDIAVKSVSSQTGNVYVDKAYVGNNRNIGNGSLDYDWTAYTPTFTGLGTVSNVSFLHRRQGSNLYVKGTFTVGTTSAATASMTLPSSLTIDTGKVSLNNTTANPGEMIGNYENSEALANSRGVIVTATGTSSSLVYFGSSEVNANSALTPALGTGVTASSVVMSVEFRIPIQGWSSGLVVRADQSNYDWTAYTPTFTGFGTVTVSECYHKRDGSDLLLRCKFTAGTPTATEARISLPGSLVSHSTNIVGVQTSGFATSGGVGATANYTLMEPSVSYITFSRQDGSNASLTKLTGSSLLTAGTILSLNARIPIQGWTENQSAPLISGLMVNEYSGQLKEVSAYILNNGTCTISWQSGGVSSCSRTAAGSVTVNFTAGTFSVAPVCAITPESTTYYVGTGDAVANTTTVAKFATVNPTVARGDSNFQLRCVGAR